MIQERGLQLNKSPRDGSTNANNISQTNFNIKSSLKQQVIDNQYLDNDDLQAQFNQLTLQNAVLMNNQKYAPLNSTQNPNLQQNFMRIGNSQHRATAPTSNGNIINRNLKMLSSGARYDQQLAAEYYQNNQFQNTGVQIMSSEKMNSSIKQGQSPSTYGQPTMNFNGSSNYTYSNQPNNQSMRSQKKVIMRLSKSPIKHQQQIGNDNSFKDQKLQIKGMQNPQEFIMKRIMQKERNLSTDKAAEDKWMIQNAEKRIIVKQSPQREKRVVKKETIEMVENNGAQSSIIDDERYEVLNRNLDDLKKELLSDDELDNDDSFDQLEIDDCLEEAEELQQNYQQNKKKQIGKPQSPTKKSQNFNSNDDLNNSDYSPQKVVAQMLLKKDRKIPNSVLKPHSEEVFIMLSTFYSQNADFRVYFPYPKYCHRTESAPSYLSLEHNLIQDSRNYKLQQLSQKDLKRLHMTLGFKFTETTHIYNSVVNSLKNAGFRILGPNSNKWNVTWTGVTKPEMLKDMSRYQRVNHFPQSFHLGRKDLMWKNIQRMKKLFPQDYDICPATYLLPDDYKKLMFDRESDNQKSLYIMKPNASSCGKGIQVIGPQDAIPKKGGYLISKYVANPHLIDGLKYDLRIYVLVTSYDPLKIYLFREGLTRFATEKYSTNLNSLKKRFVHLTNYSVNKRNVEGYVRAQDKGAHTGEESAERSSKWNLYQLKRQFDKMGIDFSQVKGRIKDVIIKTIISVEPHVLNTMYRSTRHRNVCFEVYGFDILLDSKLKPWLLEVNISPSLSSSSPLDKKIKTMLICDTLNLSGVFAYDRKQFKIDQEINVKKRLLGLDKQQIAKDKEINPNFQRIIKLIAKDEKNSQISEEDLQIVMDFEEEQHRRGNFDLIFPIAKNIPYYEQFFECNRFGNEFLWKYLKRQQQTSQNLVSIQE